MSPNGSPELHRELVANAPFLRRYARALTGSQSNGDAFALKSLEEIVKSPDRVTTAPNVKVGLFRVFHDIWAKCASSETSVEMADLELLEARAQWRLSSLAPNTRKALLMRSVEQMSFAEIAEVLDVTPDVARGLVDKAFEDLGNMVAGKVLIIEDEAIISMDLNAIVTDMGHEVTGIARTADAAIEMGKEAVPELILADIQLADKSSGVDAVNGLLEYAGDIPVIFITAFPERLLTGERPEPAFLITKPYVESQVRVAVSQAMFFATTQNITLSS